MVRCNLKRIMVERKKWIRQLYRETGIRLQTLSKLSNNTWLTVSADVIEKLCVSLDVTPGELFEVVADKEKKEKEAESV